MCCSSTTAKPAERLDEGKQEVWYYDYRTNIHHTFKEKLLRFEDLAEFIQCYKLKPQQA
ncbi:MAG: hypothetical protein R3E64_13065 [Halioglobus sp.]